MARVADDQADVLPLAQSRMLPRVTGVHHDVARLHRERAAVGHRIARIDRQVEDHLVQPARIGVDGPQRFLQVGAHGDVFADAAAQQAERGAHDLIEIRHLRLHDLPPLGGQQLLGQVAALGGRGLDVVEEAAVRLEIADQARQDLAAGEDHHQHVIEVVGDAAGELAEALQLLGLEQLRFQRAALGEVVSHGGEAPESP